MVGSVSTQLLRRAGTSILVAPPLEEPDYVAEMSAEPRRRSDLPVAHETAQTLLTLER